MAVLAAYIAAFSLVGFVLPTLAVLLVWLRFLAGESWRTAATLAVCCTAGLYVLFAIVLGVPFPESRLLAIRG